MADQHLAEQLRDCADAEPGPFHPHWAAEAQRLMRWAADALLAAEYALDDYRRRELAQAEAVAWVDERAISWLAGRRGKASAHVTTKLSAAKSLERPMALYTAPQQAEPVQPVPCDHCSSPLFAAVQCRVCGRKAESIDEALRGG